MVTATALHKPTDLAPPRLAAAPDNPPNWEEATLETLSAFITKGSTPTTYGYRWERNGVLFLRSECVATSGLDLGQSMFISADAHSFFRRSQVTNGDILMTITGNVGRVVRLVGVESANINQHIARIRITSPQVVPSFVYHFLSQPRILSQYESITTGQAYPQISLKQVRETVIRLPLRKEQQAIADVLSDADALIESLEQLIAKKRAVKQGAMQELLSGRRRLPSFSGEWPYVPFGSVFEFLPTATNSRADLGPDGDAYYVHYGDIHTRFHTHLDFGVSAPPKIARARCPAAAPLRNGDWIMADASEDFDGVGKSVEVRGLDTDDIAVAGLHTFLLRERVPTFVPGFKGHLGAADYLRKQYMRVMTGMKVYGVSKSALRDLLVPIPPIDEQAALVEVLDDFNADIAALETRLEKARQIKQGMMQELLTGRVRLV